MSYLNNSVSAVEIDWRLAIWRAQTKCYVTMGRSVFDVNSAVVSPLTRAGLRRATKGVYWGDNC